MKEGPGFLYKVFSILQDEDYEDIIAWNDNGDGFRVKNIRIFQENVLPLYFKHQNFQSFVRQLNMYDFHKTEKYAFKHQLFHKDKKEQLCQIRRKKNDLLILPQSVDHVLEEFRRLVIRNQELEKCTKFIVQKSENLRKENQFLWAEIIRIKKENNNEKLLDWIIESAMKCQSLSAESILTTLGKNISKKDLIKLASKFFQGDTNNSHKKYKPNN